MKIIERKNFKREKIGKKSFNSQHFNWKIYERNEKWTPTNTITNRYV